MERADPSPTCGGLKIQEGYLRSEESQPTPGPLAQGSSARKISPHNFWLQNSVGIESVEETSGAPCSSSQRTSTGTHLLDSFSLSSSIREVT